MFAGCLAIFVILSSTAALLYYTVGVTSHNMGHYARVCGFASSIIVLIMWCPQIYTTYKLKGPGSLSIPMLCIQLPGSLLVVYFQISEGAEITTWGPYVITAIEQFILIIMCTIFTIQRRRQTSVIQKRREEEDRRLLHGKNNSDVIQNSQ
eukprot:TRINITY_DN7163_c0_g3_i1.p1 TRINITY_DN7163_c0_g3~~TRINITY_DN7163_c0_g3_i1.p1  ORF type:complete len:151 (+),score=3.45 TRINITY_DN7163_c0_g3_i1:177-629(+)